MIKTFVLDTNVLLHSPQALDAFEENTIVLPMAVIEELDKFKTSNDELGRNARYVIRTLDRLRQNGKLGDGVQMDNKGILKILVGKHLAGDAGLDPAVADNRILGVAYHLHLKGENVIFVSKDINVRVKADALGIVAQDYENQKINVDELYTGFIELPVPGEFIDEFYKNEVAELESDLYPNEFVILKDELNEKHSAMGRAIDHNTLVPIAQRSEHVWNIRPRSKEQRMALELLLDPAVELVTIVGQAGTGKTLLAIAAALELTLKHEQYDRVLVTRPIIPMGKDIGYLPGAKDQKLAHWMQPIFDNLSYLLREEGEDGSTRNVTKRVDELIQKNVLELEALTYIRGRSIPRQYVIVDEAQNLTPHEVKTIISRAGEGTKMILTGDPYQIDNPYLDAASNGLSYVAERLKEHTVHGHITLHKSERSALAAVAAMEL